jgi:hypothetical protein
MGSCRKAKISRVNCFAAAMLLDYAAKRHDNFRIADHPEVIPSGSESQMPGGATAKGAFLQPQAF